MRKKKEFLKWYNILSSLYFYVTVHNCLIRGIIDNGENKIKTRGNGALNQLWSVITVSKDLLYKSLLWGNVLLVWPGSNIYIIYYSQVWCTYSAVTAIKVAIEPDSCLGYYWLSQYLVIYLSLSKINSVLREM